MDQTLDRLEKKVLVEVVQLVQKRRMRGTVGGWTDFLNLYDKKFGCSVSDPSRRSDYELSSFLKTFNKKKDLKFIEEALQSHMNRDSVEQSKDIIPADESPEQKLQILESEKAMLLLHKIPISVPSEELRRVVPGDFNFTVRVKNDQLKANARGRNYCAVVIFSNPQEADQAFENVNGKPEKDLAGLPQKLVEFQFDAGITTKLYVRKMARDNPYEVWRKKRVLLFQGKENSGESKKLNTEQKIKEEISSKSKKLKTEQEIKEEEISCESKKLKTEQEIKEEISGESKKLKTQQEIKEEIMVDSNQSNCDDHLKEIESSRQEEALQSHMNRDSVEQSKDIIPADESPEQILESEKAMLLLHKIPISVPSEELHRVVPGDFNFAVRVKNDQLKANARGRNYCAVVIFSNPQEADQAFENVNGKPEKDSAGLPQKLVEFQFDAGITTKLYVRKMARDNPYEVWRKKRVLLFQGKENSGESKKLNTEQKIKEEISSKSKKLKTEQEIKEEEISCESKKLKTQQEIKEEIMVDSNQSNCDDHLKEIESSRQEVSENDFQISTQDKIISEPRKKVRRRKKIDKKKEQN